jgi:hypothetical protein
VDPKYGLVFIFLSNRVNPVETNPKLSGLSIRGRIQETVYQAMGVDASVKACCEPGKKIAEKGKKKRKKK